MKFKQKAFSHQKRKEQVVMQFRIWYEKGDTEPKTMYRIARALDMTPNQRITDMLLELVDEGKLTFIQREKSGRWTARGFLLTEESLITEKYGKRRIVVKHNGKVAATLDVPFGQMELWS